MADPAATIIQLDWATVAAAVTPLAAAIATAAKFGWSAMFNYLAERDESKNHMNDAVLSAVAQLGGQVTALGGQMTDLFAKIELIDSQNRADTRAVHDHLIKALTDNTVSNQQLAANINQLVAKVSA